MYNNSWKKLFVVGLKFLWNTFLMIAINQNLTHWGQVTHICVGKLTIIGSDNGLSPGRHQAIIRTNAGILSIRPLGTNFSEILIEILTFSFKKMRLKVSSAKRPQWVKLTKDTLYPEIILCMHTANEKQCYNVMSHWLATYTKMVPKYLIFTTNWGWDRMIANLQMTFRNSFSGWFKFHWNLFPMIQLLIIQNWFGKWLGTNEVTSHNLD